MIDLHTHILPGLDDGPKTMSESADIVALLADLGFDHIFLTPHFRQGFYENPADLVLAAADTFQEAVRGRFPSIRFTAAHEVHLGSVFDSHGRTQGFLRFGDERRLVLLEMPRQQFPFELLLHTIDRLFAEGICVVLAHPEKHPELAEHPERYRELCERGVRLQVNLTSLSGFSGRQIRKTAEFLCSAGMVHGLGTDSHRFEEALRFVPKGLRRAHELLGEERVNAVTDATDLQIGQAREILTWS